MASGPDLVESEGKILASAANLCELCDQKIAIKHCGMCPLYLCVTCAKGHVKVPATRDHQLTDIKRAGSAAKSTQAAARNGSCTKHGNQPFTILCKDCIELGCDSCRTGHSSHSIQTLDGDPKLCHRVVTKNIQHLLDDVHELEEIKSVLEGQICAYDDALVRVDLWEVDLLKLIQEKANKIRRQLKDLKDEKYKQLSDQVNGLMAKLKVIDQSIPQMTAIRKSMDFTALSTSLSESQDLIRNLENFKENMKPLPASITVDDVLPNGENIKTVDGDLDLMFTVKDMHIKNHSPLPVAEWRFTEANGGKDLSVHGKNHVTMQNVTYGVGPRGETQGAVVVPKSGTESMIVVNPDEKLGFKGEMTFVVNLFVEGEGSCGYLFIYDTGVTSSKYNDTYGTYVFIYDDHTRLSICSGSSFNTPQILIPNSWNKIAVVLRQTSVSVYVNGSHACTRKTAIDISQTYKGHLHFGRRPGGPAFEGRIASCKFYDVALDENTIKNL